MRVVRVGFKDLIQAVMDVLDYRQAIAHLEERQAIEGADKTIAGLKLPKLQALTLGVDIDPQVATVRVRHAQDFNFVEHAPADAEQPVVAPVEVVKTTTVKVETVVLIRHGVRSREGLTRRGDRFGNDL